MTTDTHTVVETGSVIDVPLNRLKKSPKNARRVPHGEAAIEALAASIAAKRILLVDGEPVGGINRVPAPGQIRSNLAVGGRADAVDLTPRDLELCAIIGPQLRARGLLFVGVDVIGDYLTEINVTSPTGARALKHLSGIDAITALWVVIETKRAGG